VTIKVEQINVNVHLDTCNANRIKIGVNEMKTNDSEMSMRCNNNADNKP